MSVFIGFLYAFLDFIQHPESASYIFGPEEDGTLDESILSSFLRVLLDD